MILFIESSVIKWGKSLRNVKYSDGQENVFVCTVCMNCNQTNFTPIAKLYLGRTDCCTR